MKRTGYFHIALLAASVALGACNQTGAELPDPDVKGFVASQEKSASDTRTVLDSYSVLWSADDTITVFKASLIADGYAGCKVGIDPADGGKPSGRFYNPECEDYYGSLCYAAYPASMCTGAEGSNLKFNLPAVQYWRDNSFDSGANPTVAVTSDKELNFKNLCGLLAISFSGAPAITEIQLTTLVEEALWGEGSVDMGYTDVPVLKMSQSITPEQKTLTLKIDNPALQDDGRFVSNGTADAVADGVIAGDHPGAASTYYFVVPAGSLGQGFVVTAKCADGTYMQKYATSSNAVIERSTCVEMPEFEYQDESEIEIRTDVINKAFYKDLVMDSGCGLTNNKTIPVTNYLNLSTETIYTEDEEDYVFTDEGQNAQNRLICGTANDENGVLLYPDGEPRYRMIYVNGGIATRHGRSLMEAGREHFRQYFFNGGSYLGTCAGSFIATYGIIDSYIAHNGYMGIWPGYASDTSTPHIYPDYKLPDDCPLLKYYDFGGDHRIKEVRHHNGPYFEHWDMVPGTEVLAYNDYPAYKFHTFASCIAYNPSIYSGRVILLGGHPELAESGEQLDFFAALCRYAMEGGGIAKVKGILHNGQTRNMTKGTSDNDPAFTKVGDKQCHHFAFALPEGARNIKVRLEAKADFNLSLRLAKGTFAFKEDAQYAVENPDLVKELKFDSLSKGTWYVGVQCEDTVNQTFGKYGIAYSGKTAVLNGVPYSITVSWE
ncbi:MAG: hypothetical protein MJY60_03200 [Bacteroidales bacterium]|nr:hypothetical protein [Bacteroidales bacterium]